MASSSGSELIGSIPVPAGFRIRELELTDEAIHAVHGAKDLVGDAYVLLAGLGARQASAQIVEPD